MSVNDAWLNVKVWGAEGIARNQDPQNWPQNRQKSETGNEIWRLDTSRQNDLSGLCSMCQTINFRAIFSKKLVNNRDEVPIGYLDEIVTKKNCAFCRLVVNTIRTFLGGENIPLEFQGSRIKCDLRQTPGSYEQLDDGSLAPWRSIWLVTIPILPSLQSEQSAVNLPPEGFNCRPLDTPMPWSMSSSLTDPIMTIRDIYDQETPESKFPSQRVPNWVQISRIRSWLDRCDCSIHDPARNDLPGMRLIDVVNNRLDCKPPANSRYVALSYTWGRLQREILRLTRANLGDLVKMDAISSETASLPKTIRDVMTFVKAIGEQYVWVDSVCIIQDDENDQVAQFGVMDKIYESAILTVVAAAGEDADAGLPGIQPTRRVPQQHMEEIQGLQLVNCLSPLREILDTSCWNTRGWTYQERVFSKRMLVFTKAQVYLTCQHHTFSEDRSTDQGFLEPDKTDSVAMTPSNTSFYNYQMAVCNYSRRHLTFHDDVLNAFAGIMNSLRPSLASGFALGLPESHFDHALLWHPKGQVTRRLRAGFPSWTWAAWQGEICYDYPYKLSSRVLYRNFAGGSDEYYSAQDLLPGAEWEGWDSWERSPRTWKHKTSGLVMLQPMLSEESRPSTRFYTGSYQTLQFWTQTANLDIADGPLPERFAPSGFFDLSYDNRYWKCIKLDDGVIGVVHVNVDELHYRQQRPFILMSRTTREKTQLQSTSDYHFSPEQDTKVPWDQLQFDFDAQDIIQRSKIDPDESTDQPWDLYNVLLLDRAVGTTNRLGVGVVDVAGFHQSQPKRAYISLA